MELNVYTIFNHIDDDSDQLILSASDKRVAHDFYCNWLSRSRELESKHMPPMNPLDYTIYRLGTYNTRNCEFCYVDKTAVEWYSPNVADSVI